MISPYLWLLVGLVMMLLEPVVPGLIIFFFGVGAIITGLAALAGLVTSVEMQLFVWVLSSLLLILALREQVRRIFPSLEKREESPDDLVDRLAEVITPVDGQSEAGRVRLGGTTWKARSPSGEVFASGATVRVVGSENLTLFVERAESPEP